MEEKYLVISKEWLEELIQKFTEKEINGDGARIANQNYRFALLRVLNKGEDLEPILADAYNSGSGEGYFEALLGYEDWAKDSLKTQQTLEQYLNNFTLPLAK